MPHSRRDHSNGTVILTRAQLLDNIDFEARAQLNISGAEFVERYRRGELPHSPAVFDIGILVSLLDHAPAESP